MLSGSLLKQERRAQSVLASLVKGNSASGRILGVSWQISITPRWKAWSLNNSSPNERVPKLAKSKPDSCKETWLATLRAYTQGCWLPRKKTSLTQPRLCSGQPRATHSSARNLCQPSLTGKTLKLLWLSCIRRWVKESWLNNQSLTCGSGCGWECQISAVLFGMLTINILFCKAPILARWPVVF